MNDIEQELHELSITYATLINPHLHWDLQDMGPVEREVELLRITDRMDFLMEIRKSGSN